jgi:AbiV family abortive infection protein
MKYEEIPYETLKKALIEAYNNSKDYLYESEMLYKIGSYGHSKSLSILGIEEYGKSIGYGLLATHKSIEIAGRIAFNPQELFDDLQMNHLTKQSIAITITALRCLDEKQLREVKQSIDNGDFRISYDNKKREFINYKSLSELQKLFNKWEYEFNLIYELDKIKQKGLYVEIDKDLKVNYPKKNKAIEARKSIKTLERLLAQQIFF